jgi:hypothetical protein
LGGIVTEVKDTDGSRALGRFISSFFDWREGLIKSLSFVFIFKERSSGLYGFYGMGLK